MSFKGDLSTIGLAEVFQMISMSQKEGTLIVQDAESRKAIYFGPTGVKLVSTGKRKGMRLGDLLVRAGRISAESLQDALENAKIQKRMLGEILVESGIVTDAEIQQLVREQIEEEIYDLFLWKKANFEFVEGPPDESLKDPDGPVTQLSFDVNGLLLEAVRRADEWGIINQKLPSIDSIFTWASPQARSEEDQSSSDSAKRVYRLVDGQTSVAEIVENTGAPKFEACKALVDLLDRQRIRLLEISELLEVAQRRMMDGQKEKGIKLYLAVGAQAPQDPKVAEALAHVLEGEGLEREAALQNARAGKLYLEKGDLDRALDHLRKAGELSPEDLEIRTGLFEVYAAAGNLDEGKRLAMDLAKIALMHGDPGRARSLCDRILNADAEDLDFRVLRAKALHRLNLKKDLEEDLSFIRNKMPPDPKKAEEINQALKEVLARPPATKTPPPPSKERPKKKSRKPVGVVILLILLGAAGALAKVEWDAKKVLDAAFARATELADRQDFAGARREIESVRGGTFTLLQKGRVDNAVASLGRREEAWRAAQEARGDLARKEAHDRMNALKDSVVSMRDVTPETALEKARELKRIADEVKDPEFGKFAEDQIASLDRFLNDARQLKGEADQLESDKKFVEAAQKIDQLFREYRTTQTAAAASYPLEITTIPAGVRVLDKSGGLRGDTSSGPLVIRMKDAELVRLVFEKRGYMSVEKSSISKTQGKLTVLLTEKVALWSMYTGFCPPGEPAVAGEIVFVTDGAVLYAIALPGKVLVWSEPMKAPVVGSPCFSNGRLYLASGNLVTAFDQPTKAARQKAWEYDAGGQITCAPVQSSDGAMLFVVASRTLHAVDSKTGTALWKKQIPSDAVAEPVMVDGMIVVASDGVILGINQASQDESFRIKDDARFLASSASESMVYLTGSDQTIQAIDLKTKKQLWKKLLPDMPTGRPARVGNQVYISGKTGRIFRLNAQTGNQEASYQPAGPIPGGVAPWGNLLLFGSEDKSFYAFDTEQGTVLWTWKNKDSKKAKVIGMPVAKAGRVFFCSEDSLFAIELN